MPTYTFCNKETEEEYDKVLTLAEREDYLAANPNVYQVIKKSEFISGHGGIKNSDGFKDVLRTIKKQNPGSTIEV